jgi:hypothetical protein
MKKFVVLSLMSFLILAFGATVYGQEKAPVLQFKASGFIDAQTITFRNVSGGNPASGIYGIPGTITFAPTGRAIGQLDHTSSYLESRARLKFDAIMGKEVSGTFLFEMDSSTWGDTPGGFAGKISERNSMGFWSGDRAAFEIKNVYIDFGVPVIPVPTTVRVGLQTLGLRPGLLLLTDGMGISAGFKADPVLIAPFWGRPYEGGVASADDANVYGLHANAKISTLTIGGYGMFYDMNTYPFFVPTTANVVGTAGNFTLAAVVPGSNRAEFLWLGAYADGKLGPVNLNFDFIYDDGKVEDRAEPIFRDVDYSGWMARLNVSFPWEKFLFGVAGAYGTGADKNDTDATGLPGGTNSDVDSFVVPPGSESAAAFGESVVFFSTFVNRGDSGIATRINYNSVSPGAFGGVWYAKAYAAMQVMPTWKLTFMGLYIGDTTDNGDTFGSSREVTGALKDKDNIGIELSMISEHQIYKNLKFSWAGGYLAAGDALKYWNGFENKDPKDPWIITTNLTYSF